MAGPSSAIEPGPCRGSARRHATLGMAGIPDETIERIREQTDIAEVIGAHVGLKRSGKQFKGLCPFHDEKTPSFNVNADRQIFHCFGCQEGGDVLGCRAGRMNLDALLDRHRLDRLGGRFLRAAGDGAPGGQQYQRSDDPDQGHSADPPRERKDDDRP